MAEHIYTFDDPPSERDLDRANYLLDHDGIIAYTADENWQFGCDASSQKALDRIRLLRPNSGKEKPFSLICADISGAADIGNIDHVAYRVLKKVWPGPYTVLLESNRTLPRQIKDKRRVVGVRIPNSAMVTTLVGRRGKPIATASAPPLPKDQGPATFGYQIEEYFGHGLDLILDLGREVTGTESTIVDLTSGAPEIIRQGAGPVDIFDTP